MTVYGFGEVLLRYTPPNYEQLKDANTLGVNVGGAELNALVTLAQFGHATEMLTALPNHALGQLALQKMYQSRVGTQLIQHVDGRMETYYMEDSFGFRSGKVIYDREHSTFAEQGHVVMDDVSIKAGDYVILTGITLAINETIREQIVDILKKLKAQGAHIVFDINFRSNLWSKDVAVPVIKSILPLVDVLFFGKKDATHLLETNVESDDMKDCAETIQRQYGIPLMASSNRDIEQSTLQGVVLSEKGYLEGESYQYTVLNRIGSGDAFMASVLHGLINQLGVK
ncbi:sugar kinase [Staphylococcus saprophyticus]|uniref:sugar kinase n=1 Tax=Staphylococcus saprophyticus TaxID=29385 RepID=UPI001CDA3B57|nr:sugar kinase [Staphylococcus saprophyticus]MDW3886996.1 sugar kinase [Staphylococcus saprophyticus]MDW3899375.1 sugar kinase [Staphylococcus saprophyticus]MDW3904216.1 sugar kinase [Staphylococcus saprophyticus]MDW3969657.1 sugar kinase [Staphylococcus saprophyticus]MDW3981875.1 sugar kinase [Staphylococcus saprophyticus]